MRILITETEAQKARELLEQYDIQQSHEVRISMSEDCPSQDFKQGKPNGTCESDGHYKCAECVHFNTVSETWR